MKVDGKNLLTRVKPEILFTDFQKTSPDLLVVLGYFSGFCLENNLPCLITSITDDAPGRQSKTHKDGRAFDASVRHWDLITHLDKCLAYMRKYTNYLGAISKNSGKQNVVIFHNAGTGPHLHFQVRK